MGVTSLQSLGLRFATTARSAGFQTGCIADFQIGGPFDDASLQNRKNGAGWKRCDAAMPRPCCHFFEPTFPLDGRNACC
jgi:hypothetical protein